MKIEKTKVTLLDDDEIANLDSIYKNVSQYSLYPISLFIITGALSWGSGGMLIFLANILAATPGMKIIYLWAL